MHSEKEYYGTGITICNASRRYLSAVKENYVKSVRALDAKTGIPFVRKTMGREVEER